MSDTCPTVRVNADNEQGFMVINESDFDGDVHERFVSDEQAEDDPAPRRRGRPAKAKE